MLKIPADEIAKAFLEDLQRIPSLRPGVRSGLETLHDFGEPVHILTEGHRERCEELLRHYRLRHLVDRVIEGKKTVELYRRLRKLEPLIEGLPPIIVGDQIDRDILASKEAGFVTVYFPGGFIPQWSPMTAIKQADHEVRRFDEAARIILATRSRKYVMPSLPSGAGSAN